MLQTWQPHQNTRTSYESINVYFLHILTECVYFFDFYYCFSFESTKLFSRVKIIRHMFHKCVSPLQSIHGGALQMLPLTRNSNWTCASCPHILVPSLTPTTFRKYRTDDRNDKKTMDMNMIMKKLENFIGSDSGWSTDCTHWRTESKERDPSTDCLFLLFYLQKIQSFFS